MGRGAAVDGHDISPIAATKFTSFGDGCGAISFRKELDTCDASVLVFFLGRYVFLRPESHRSD